MQSKRANLCINIIFKRKKHYIEKMHQVLIRRFELNFYMFTTTQYIVIK